MTNYARLLNEAKIEYKKKNYTKSYEIYTDLYRKIPFDRSSRYSYAWSIYQSRVRNFTSPEQLFADAELITGLTEQNNLNRTQLCVYTMSVFKVLKLLYRQRDYDSLTYWLSKIRPDFLDDVRFTSGGEVYPSNRETYYVYASTAYYRLKEYEKCIDVSLEALGLLTRFTGDNGDYLLLRVSKSLRFIGEYSRALKYLEKIRLDEWYVYYEMAENYYFLQLEDESLEYALKAAVKDGPGDMKYNLYTLLYDLLKHDCPEIASMHEKLTEKIRVGGDYRNLEDELYEFWMKMQES